MISPRRPILEQQRAKFDRVRSVTAQETWVFGRFLVDGLGEFFIDVQFATLFYERPILLPGAVEIETGSPEREHFPTSEMAVGGWIKKSPSNGGPASYYSGANLVVRMAGRSDQRVWASYAFVGKALSSLNVE